MAEGTQMQQDWNALSDDEFRKLIRAFFVTHYPEELRYSAHRLGMDKVGGWYKTLSDHGWIAPAWPRAFGGAGLDPRKLIIFIEEQEAHGVSRVPDHGIIMVGPLLIQQGTPEQQQRYLPKIISGEEIWCQGYSEPNAGSDLASLRTEAVLDGDVFVINGQKTWSTLAQEATHMFLLARTDKNVRKQEGISFILLSMSTPGITVRPMRTLSGAEEFCEVFFDNVRVPRSGLVGELNKGWGVAKDLLSFERLFLGSPKLAQGALARLGTLAQLNGKAYDPAFRAAYDQVQLDVADLNSLYRRFTEQVRNGQKLGADISLLKIWGTETFQRITELILDCAGPASMVDGPTLMGNQAIDVLSPFYNARPSSIYGGTNEIQRNILASSVLGLPSA